MTTIFYAVCNVEGVCSIKGKYGRSLAVFTDINEAKKMADVNKEDKLFVVPISIENLSND